MKSTKNKVKSILKFIIIAILCIVITIIWIMNKNNVKDISTQKHTILAETPIYALDSTGGTSVQQGNLVIYAESNLSLPNNNARNTFGKGEVIVFEAQFNKVLKEARICKLSFHFGDGEVKTIEPESTTLSENKIIFKYTIDAPDNGTLALTALSGTVVDIDNTEVRIGLPTGNIIIAPGTIRADTSETAIDSSTITKNDNTITATIRTTETVYINDNNTLVEATTENSRSIIPYIGFEGARGVDTSTSVRKGKNELANYEVRQEAGKTTFTIVYNINPGDQGITNVYLLDLYDIAGNQSTLKYSDQNCTVTATTNTPTIQNTEITLKPKTTAQKSKFGELEDTNTVLYLLEGDEVEIKVTFEEDIYSSSNYKQISDISVWESNTELSTSNAKAIKVKVGDGEKEASATEITDKKTVIYKYTVSKDDEGQFNGYEIPASTVVDNVGWNNSALTYQPSRGNRINIIWPEKDDEGNDLTSTVASNMIKIDAKAPTLVSLTPTDTTAGIFKEEGTINGTVTFSEPVTGSSAMLYFNNSEGQTTSINLSATNQTIVTFSEKVKSGDNGLVNIHIAGDVFADEAGNKMEEASIAATGSEIAEGIYADTEKPEIKITPEIEEGANVIKYTFEITDNSQDWQYRINQTTTQGGIANNSFREDDVSVPASSTILDKGYNDKENLIWLEVQVGTDGVQSLIVKENSFTDIAGNTNDREQSTITVDRIPPTIDSITLNPTDWTNEKVTVTINASDGNGIKEYSFDDGQTWVTDKTKEFTENTTLKIKVKDKANNLSDSREVTINNIDKDAPTLTTTVNENKINITASDSASGIAQCEIDNETVELSNGTYTYTAEKNGKYTIKVTDNAGNTTTKEAEVTSIKEPDDPNGNGVKLKIIENDYIKEVTDVPTEEEETKQYYIVLSKEMTATELSKNIEAEEGTAIISDSKYNNKTGGLATGDLAYAQSEDKTKGVIYTIIVKGDVNQDAKVDVNDMFQINKCRLGNLTFNKLQKIAGDVNEDSLIDVEDLFQINKYRLGRITKF